MFGTIYTALSGMNAYSHGLDVIGNNVANMNTPGFKVSDPMFREMVYSHIESSGAARPGGAGVQSNSSNLAFTQGELRDTANPLDAAIDGSGFFVLDQDGEYRYTRAGQFQYNDEGVLVERASGAKVLISTGAAAESFFDLNTARTSAPRVTTEVIVTGTLARSGTTSTYELPNVTVYDSTGAAIVLKGKFTRSASNPLVWKVDVLGTNNAVMGTGELTFNTDGTPATSKVSINVDAAVDFPIVLNFGEAGAFDGVTSPTTSTTSQLQVLRQDGLPLGSLANTQFDDKGQLKLTYSNGESKTVGSLVLAQFDAPEQLRALGGGMFMATETAQPIFGQGLTSGLGRVVGSRLEMSNVELTQQFTDLIIMQRGYQASSQISAVANELIQTLLAMDGK